MVEVVSTEVSVHEQLSFDFGCSKIKQNGNAPNTFRIVSNSEQQSTNDDNEPLHSNCVMFGAKHMHTHTFTFNGCIYGLDCAAVIRIKKLYLSLSLVDFNAFSLLPDVKPNA